MKADIIYTRLLSRIQAGTLGDRAQLAGEHQLAKEFGASRATVRRALKRLSADGFIRTTRGRKRVVCRQPEALTISPEGFHVRKRLATLHDTLGRSKRELNALCREAPKLRERLLQNTGSVHSFGQYLTDAGLEPMDKVIDPPTLQRCFELTRYNRFDVDEICKGLNLTLEKEVIWFLRLRIAKGVPLALQTCVLSPTVFGRDDVFISEKDLRPGRVTDVFRRHGIQRHLATARCRAKRPSSDEATYLEVDTDAPLIEEKRVSYCLIQRGRSKPALVPYEYLLTLYTDRVELEYDWATVPSKDVS